MTPGTSKILWQGMGVWKWPALAAIGVCIGILVTGGPLQPQWQDHGTRSLAGDEIGLETRGLFEPGNRIEVRLQAETGEPRTFRIGFARGPSSVLQVRADSDTALTEIVVPDENTFEIVVIDSQNRDATARWTLGPTAPLDTGQIHPPQ